MNIILSGSGSTGVDISSVLSYLWTDSSSNILGTSVTQLVTSADTYTLTVMDSYNGKTDSFSLTVTDLTNSPIVNITTTTSTFTSIGQEILLVGTSSYGQYPQSDLTFQWSSSDGVILGDDANSTAIAVSGGTYTLLVTDTYNNCTDSTNKILDVSIGTYTAPVAIILNSETVLNCTNTTGGNIE